MSKVKFYEQFLIDKIFQIRLTQNPTNYLSQSSFFVQSFAKDIEELHDDISLISNSSLFDTMLMERLYSKDLDLLKYLKDCLNRALQEDNFEYNKNDKNNQIFIKISIEIIENFCFLALSNPEIFGYQVENPEICLVKNASDEMIFALKIYYHFLTHGLSHEFFHHLKNVCDKNKYDSYIPQLYKILIDKQRKNHILDSNSFFHLEFLLLLLNFDDYKMKLENVIPLGIPWIPGPADINLTKGFGSTRGDFIELSSILGAFVKISTFPHPFYNKDNFEFILQRIYAEFEKLKSKKDFSSQSQYYFDLVQSYNILLSEMFKTLLKKGKGFDLQNETLRWLNACLCSNFDRTKLGARLEGNMQQNLFSSEGFLVNLFDVMLEISKGFLDQSNPKFAELIKKINPAYLVHGIRSKILKRTPIWKDQLSGKNKIMENMEEFGTVTEFFFITCDLANIGLIQTIHSFSENLKIMNKLKEALKSMNNQLYEFKIIEKKLEFLQKLYYIYYLIIFDERRIKKTINLFDILINLILQWVSIDPKTVINGKCPNYVPNALLNHIPEDYLTMIYQFHVFHLKYDQEYNSSLNSDQLNNLVKMLTISLFKIEFISNPYVKANIVELVYYLIVRKKSLMRDVFKYNDFAKENLTLGLVNFYIEIEFTGANHQFYTKHEYRHYVINIFETLWDLDDYRREMIKISKENPFERFINLVMNDTTYCMDEGLNNLLKIQDLKQKINEGQHLSEEEEKNLENYENNSTYYLQHAGECIKLLLNLSNWTPNSFLSETFRKRLAEMLNYFLAQTTNPKLQKLLMLNLSFKKVFKTDEILLYLMLIYLNLSHDETFCKDVVSDERSFNFKSLSEYLQHLSLSEAQYKRSQEFLLTLNRLSHDSKALMDVLGEIPIEFQDPISYDLMTDPVKLPSGTIMDRKIIKQILLNHEQDPFNRSPLKYENLIEVPDFKTKIENWVKERMQANKQKQKINETKIMMQIEEEEKIPEEDSSLGLLLNKLN